MKIAVLGFTKIKYLTYMHFYLNQIDMSQDDVHLIYWLRDHNPDSALPIGVTGHAFDCPMSDAIPLTKKLPKILKYGNFAKKIIKDIKPDFLIVLHSTTGISIYSLLKGKYKKKYIFDYRDVTYERKSFYKKMVGKIVDNSALCFTSSDGFRRFLPKDATILNSHNISNIEFHEAAEKQYSAEKSTPIRVSFWGLIRNRAINQVMIDRLGGDERFELHYYGRAQGAMLEFLNESTEKYKNVFFHGEYAPTDRMEMAKNTDIIHNLYNITDKTSHIAMGNKYYDGPLFYLPQLCTKGSLMGSLCTKYGIGFECDPADDDFADKVYEYYMSLDCNTFKENCEKEFIRVMNEVEIGNTKIKEVIENAR